MTIMGEQDHNVPTIPADLRREETIIQIADSLEYLEKVANDVFTRISSRVAENRTRLQKVNDRVSLAQARVDKLKGSNKATKVFASSKYPAENEAENYHTLFGASVSAANRVRAGKRKHYRVQSKHPAADERMLREKLQFFNVHLNTKSKRDVDKGEGLGGLPRTIPSISSLLLFNTTETPYKKYTMLDPLGVVTKTRAAVTEGAAGPADAPTTIMQNEEMLRQQKENYFYVPDIGNVPEIAVPDFLPNLLGVADDVMYSEEQSESIAPSVLTTNVPDLPSILPEPDAVPSGPAAPGSAPPPPPGAAAPPPPPPPGPPPPAPPGPPPPSAPPPPPPGPPPAAPPPPPPSEGPSGPAPDGVPQEVASDGRSSLMDAIRAAGGAGKASLKSAKERKMESKKKKQEEKEKGPAPSSGGGGGDLMSDLFSKLTMRRKGISGSGKPGGGGGEKESGGGGSSSTGGGSAMDKISSMIPAPPKPAGGGGGGHGGDDEDWD